MARTSWMENEHTNRTYRIADGKLLNVDNQFQRISCPHCQGEIYCRVTRIGRVDSPDQYELLEIHTNHSMSLDDLRKLLVAYDDKDHGIEERQRNEQWVLTCQGRELGVAVAVHKESST